MAETIKITKKDIKAAKAPDAVLQAGTSVFDWMVERRNLLLGLLAAVVVATIVISVVRSSQAEKRQELGGQLALAVALLNRPVVEGAASGESSFASAADKKAAVEKAFGEIIQEQPDSDAAQAAHLQLGLFKLREGDADGAIAGIDKYLGHRSGRDLDLLAYESLGYAYEQKGDRAKAAEAFTKLADVGAPARSLYHRARLAAESGNKDEARTLFEQVTREYAEDPVASDAKVRLELLDLAPADQPGFTEPPPPAPPTTGGRGRRNQ